MTGPGESSSSERLPDALHRARLTRDRNRLIEAAALGLYSDPDASLASMASLAGLSLLTTQQLFADRDELIDAVRARAMDTLERELEWCELERGNALNALQRLTVRIVTGARTWALLPPAMWREAEPSFNERHGRLEHEIVALLTRGIDRGELRQDLTVAEARAKVRDTIAAAAESASTRKISLERACAAAVSALVAAVGPAGAFHGPEVA